MLRLDLRPGESFEHAEMALAQARLDDQLVAGQLGDRARRMVRAAGVAAIKRLEFDLLQAACEQPRLAQPDVGKRAVSLPLHAASRFQRFAWRISRVGVMGASARQLASEAGACVGQMAAVPERYRITGLAQPR